MTKIMMNENNATYHLWDFFVNTTCYIENKMYFRHILKKTPYEMWKCIESNISYFHQFGCTCFMLNTKEHLNKFDSNAQKYILLGYF